VAHSVAVCLGWRRQFSRRLAAGHVSGYRPTKGEEIPIEARIIAVADVYDAHTSDRPYRKAMPPFEARELIAKGSGTEFDPEVVEAFQAVFRRGEMEVPFVAV
jgi:HD-GYP domain-containing protein (c-di-GMP phosphodiesterase class II)